MNTSSSNGDERRSSIRLPRPLRVTLRNFSLYDNAPVVSAEFGNGVFCLAGANGLGKSTFLAAINYAITGVVADPDRRFESVQEYYKKSISYSTQFFHGRISELDEDAAQVELEMQVGDRYYRLVRGMFDPEALRELSIRSGVNGVSADVEDAGENTLNAMGMNDGERHDTYVRAVTADAGLQTFAQLVFLQHFVLTFDERRHLLFWDDRVAQAALFMAFGIDLERARRADNLRRTSERADSLARNLQWQATEIRKRLQELEAASAQAESGQEQAYEEDIGVGHRVLLEEHEAAHEDVTRFRTGLRDAELRLADETAQFQAAKKAYEAAYRERLATRRPPEAHPAVAQSLETSHCAVCSADGPSVGETIRRRLNEGRCPLCGSQLPSGADMDAIGDDALRDLNNLMARHDVAIHEARHAVSRLAGSLDSAESALRSITERIGAYERANEIALTGVSREAIAVRSVADQYRAQIAELMSRKRVELDRRNQARSELRVLQDELAVAYSDAEYVFVPRFTALAREFIGLDLEVDFQAQSSGVQLVLSMQSTRRRERDTLSESQRFFLDIALRMALAQQMSTEEHRACLYIDTPEGSLDIAYESRAGSMFGRFVGDGYQLIMTANINTSQLLLNLATSCGSSRMTLSRMIDWTSLSEVQSAQEDLFDQAYTAIEEALEAGQ